MLSPTRTAASARGPSGDGIIDNGAQPKASTHIAKCLSAPGGISSGSSTGTGHGHVAAGAAAAEEDLLAARGGDGGDAPVAEGGLLLDRVRVGVRWADFISSVFVKR